MLDALAIALAEYMLSDMDARTIFFIPSKLGVILI
jgi:hypothetical protein